MAYMTISTWKVDMTPDEREAAWQMIQEKYVPLNQALGATQVMIAETGEGGSVIVSVYPDKATRDAAEAKISEMRSQASSEFSSTLTGEMRGEIRASS